MPLSLNEVSDSHRFCDLLDTPRMRFDTASLARFCGDFTLRKQFSAIAAGVLALTLAVAGCATHAADAPLATAVSPAPSAPTTAPTPPATRQSQSRVVAKVGDMEVTLQQLERPLIEGYGLNVLLNLVQLELVKSQTKASDPPTVVTADDVAAERELTIENMFKESNDKQMDKIRQAELKGQTAEVAKLRDQMKKDNEQAFEQFLSNQHISRAEFDIVIETNAHLRKIAEPLLKGKITDDNVKEAFATLYGETIKVRHIQCANLQEVQEAKRRLDGGEPFPKVAIEMSRNPSTGPLGGELPPFSRQYQGLPQTFRDAAFALKEGQVSEVVQAEGSFHLILLEKRIPPKAVKFEDVKETLRVDLEKRALEAGVKELRQQLSEQAIGNLSIMDPVLKKQWDERLEKRKGELKNREEILKQKERERSRAVTQPSK